MLKELKFQHNDNQKIFFWGCTHIFHAPKWDEPLWKLRGYDSVESHAKSLKEKINSLCRPQDVLFLLGDGFLTSTPEQVEEYLFQLNPKIQYLWGNHESSMIRLYRKHRDYQYGNLVTFNENDEIYPLRYKNLTYWGNYLECWINKRFFVLQHFPSKVWNHSKIGAGNLHSHCHGGLPSSLPDAQEGRILDCGVDVFPDGPVSFERICEIMDKKDIKSVDRHH